MSLQASLSDLLEGFAPIPRDCSIAGIQCRSAAIRPGDLFAACRGTRRHGLEGLPEALGKGAAAVIYEPDPDQAQPWADVPCVAVPDLSRSLSAIAGRFYRDPSARLPVIGITGTDGKTSTSHLIDQILGALEQSCGVIGTLGAGRLTAMQLVKNELYATDSGTLRPRATDQFEDLPVDMVFRSVGYRGVPLPDVPFDERRGVIANADGRVLETAGQESVTGIYASGWIKRGPTGVIGTNKPDALQTVKCMVADAAEGKVLKPSGATAEAAAKLVRERQPEFFSYADWLHLNKVEMSKGKAIGAPRVKFTRVDEMLAARRDGGT